jgi:tetratricopeptide (TPR) repeat protein
MLTPLPNIFYLDAPQQGQALQPLADGRPHPMIAMFEEVLRRARARKSRPDEASALTDLGRAYLQTGHPRRALPLLNAALPLYRDLGDSEREGLTLELISLCHRALGDLPRSCAALEEALRIAEQAGNQELCTARLLGVGALYTQQKQPALAAPYYEKGARLAESLQLDYYLASGLALLGQSCTEQGRHRESIPHFRRAIEVYHRLGNKLQEEVTRSRLGLDLVLAAQEAGPAPKERAPRGRQKPPPGEAAEGMRMMQQSCEALIQMEQWIYVPVLADNIGQLLWNQRDHKGAVEWFQRALAALDRCGGVITTPSRGMVLHRLALVTHISGDTARARERYEQALPHLLREGARREHAMSQANLATLLIPAGQTEKAITLLKEAVATAKRLRDDEVLSGALTNLGLLYYHAGRRHEALPVLEEALAPLRRSGSAHSLGLVLQALDNLRALRVEEPPAEPPPFVN